MPILFNRVLEFSVQNGKKIHEKLAPYHDYLAVQSIDHRGGRCRENCTMQMFRSGGTDYPKEYLMTVDVEYNVKVVNIPDTDVQVELYLYDCAGQPIFNSQDSKGQFPNQRHWKGSSMIALVYDVSRPDTFRKCKTTLAKVRHHICKDRLTPGVLIANKIDRYSTKLDCVEMRDGAKFADNYALRFFETSAKEGTDVDQPFNYLADMFYQSYERHLKAAGGGDSEAEKASEDDY